MNVRGYRAPIPVAGLDDPQPRILCGGLNGQCREVIAWVRPTAAHRVIVIPAGLTDAETPGTYRWSRKARERIAQGLSPDWNRDHDSDYVRGGDADIRFARLPCVVPCRRGHQNDVDDAVLSG